MERSINKKQSLAMTAISILVALLLVLAIKQNIEVFRKNNPRPSEYEMIGIAFGEACEEFRKKDASFDCDGRIEFINGYTIPLTVTDNPPFVFWFMDKRLSKPDSAVGIEITLRKNGVLDSIADLPDLVKSGNIENSGWTYKPIFLK